MNANQHTFRPHVEPISAKVEIDLEGARRSWRALLERAREAAGAGDEDRADWYTQEAERFRAGKLAKAEALYRGALLASGELAR